MVTISYRGAGVHVVVMLIGDFCKIPKEEEIHIGYEACLYLVSIFVKMYMKLMMTAMLISYSR